MKYTATLTISYDDETKQVALATEAEPDIDRERPLRETNPAAELALIAKHAAHQAGQCTCLACALVAARKLQLTADTMHELGSQVAEALTAEAEQETKH